MLKILMIAFVVAHLGAAPKYESCFPWQHGKLRSAKLFKAAYERGHYDCVEPSENPRIPKIIHHIWVGGTLPPVFQKYINSWKKHHPDWEHRLWTDEDVKSFEFVTKKAYFRCKNPGHKADILRYEILNKFGGLYVDTDFLCLKPHDKLHHSCDFYTGMGQQTIYIGIIGSAPGHPIIKNCLERILSCSKFYGSPKQIASNTGALLFTQSIRSFLGAGHEGAVVYPPSYYYSFPGRLRSLFWSRNENMGIVKRFIKPESLAVHLWAVSWHPTSPSTGKARNSLKSQSTLEGAKPS